MELFEAIYARQSVGKVKLEPLPRSVIEKLLAAGAQAPNHFKVRPWRFVVLTGAARDRLGEVMAVSMKARFPDLTEEGLAKERAKPLRAPVIIAVAVDQPVDAKVNEVENIAAVAAACQNILLAAHAEGLGAVWRTGDNARDPLVKEFFGFAPGQHLIGFLYIGKLENSLMRPERPSFEDRTIWME